jgi:cob(I)alamin adenosyltransferase
MLYTRQGDAGYTNVIGGPALPKCNARLEVLGALDEVQAHLGVARAHLDATPWITPVQRVQHELRLLMAEVATVARQEGAPHYLAPALLHHLEDDLQRWELEVGGFTGFLLPGATMAGAHLHLARTVIRRAERHAVALHESGEALPLLVLTYLNRLSSWAYVLALLVEHTLAPIAEEVA